MKFTASVLAIFFAVNGFAAEIVIKIKNIENTEGPIYIAIWDSEESWKQWPQGKPFKELKGDLQMSETTFRAEVPAGVYAISVFQDLNANQNLDRNLIGMPKEPWGMSNDAPAVFGPPKWEKMRFEVGNDAVTAEINLRN